MQNEVSLIFQSKLLPAIEEVCDQLDVPGHAIRLDKLELNLGELPISKFEEELPSRIKQHFYDVLIREIQSLKYNSSFSNGSVFIEKLPGEEQGVHTTGQAELDELMHFLETGTLPWWSGKKNRQVEQLLRKVLAQSPEAFKARIVGLLDDQNIRDRLVYQFSKEALQDLLTIIDAQKAKTVVGLWRELESVNITSNLYPQSDLKHHLSRTALVAILDSEWAKPGTSTERKKRLLLLFLEGIKAPAKISGKASNAKDIDQVLFTFFEAIQNKPETDAETKQLRKLLEAVLKERKVDISPTSSGATIQPEKQVGESDHDYSSETGKTPSADNTKEDQIAAARDDQQNDESHQAVEKGKKDGSPTEGSTNADDIAWKDVSEETTSGEEEKNQESAEDIVASRKSQKAEADSSDAVSSSAQTDDADQKKRHSKETPGQESKATVSTKTKAQSPQDLWKRFESKPEVEEVHIYNAGLVLLHPFLNLYFEELGFTQDKAFVDERAQERAALLLQYLVNGETQAEEHELPFNKLLCGLDITTAIPAQIELTEQEIEESQSLLEQVVQHWTALKGTSVNGLRGTFLQKEGALTKDHNGWRLQIERATVDILIDRLPWGISIIRLPWLDEMIYVEW